MNPLSLFKLLYYYCTRYTMLCWCIKSFSRQLSRLNNIKFNIIIFMNEKRTIIKYDEKILLYSTLLLLLLLLN